MAKTKKRFLIKDGIRFEVTPHGLFCSPEGEGEKNTHAPTANSASGVRIRGAAFAFGRDDAKVPAT